MVSKSTWEEVFALWREHEGGDPYWIRHAIVDKGWSNWESWRRFSASLLGLEHRQWNIDEIAEPLEEIPAMLVGPFKSWQSRLPEMNRYSFRDLVAIPKQYNLLVQDEKIKSMLAHPFLATTIIGLKREDNGKIICIEGHHRSTAIALAAHDHLDLKFNGPIKIAIADLPISELPLLEAAIERGSTFGVS